MELPQSLSPCVERQGSTSEAPRHPRPPAGLPEWVSHGGGVETPDARQILGIEHGAPGFLGGAEHQRIPERQLMQPLEVGGSQHVVQIDDRQVRVPE